MQIRFKGEQREAKTALSNTIVSVCLLASIAAISCGNNTAEASSSVAQSELVQSLVGAGAGGPEQIQQTLTEAGELTARCMAEQGFEWEMPPMPTDGALAFISEATETPRDFAAEWGFGISTQYFSESEVPVGVKGRREPLAEFVDPNAEYLAGLDEGAKEEYYLTLSGADGQGGCQLSSWEKVSKQPRTVVIENFGEELTRVNNEMLNDPRMIDLDSQMVSCLGEKGYAFGSFEEISTYFESKSESIAGDFFSSENTNASLSDEAANQLRDLQNEEIALAIDAEDCKTITDYAKVGESVSEEYYSNFVQDNWSDISSLTVES